MAIQFQCICGRALTLRDELAGKVIRCPQCAQALPVPGGEEIVEVVEALEETVAAGPPPLPRAVAETARPPLPQQKQAEEIVEVEIVDEAVVVDAVVVDAVVVEAVVVEAVSAGPPPLPKAPPRKEGYAAAPPPRVEPPLEPKKKKKKKGSVYSETFGKQKQAGSIVFDEGWFGNGFVGGAAMMLLGIVAFMIIFFIGIPAIRALIYSGILFVLGLLAMLKGLVDLYEE